VKKLFLATVLVALSLTGFAQSSPRRQAMSKHGAGDPSAPTGRAGNVHVPPSLCSPCLFYGGDLDINNPNAAGLSDENTLLISGGSATYGSVTFPSTATVTGVLVNVQASTAFDPLTASYDIRTGVSEGNAGTSVASGSGPVSVALTGRSFLGLTEFTVFVPTSAPVVLDAGQYWVALTPQCTNTLDGSCYAGRIFVSNTTGLANNRNGKWQTPKEAFFNSTYFGLSWNNWCDFSIFELNGPQCSAVSFGLTGTD